MHTQQQCIAWNGMTWQRSQQGRREGGRRDSGSDSHSDSKYTGNSEQRLRRRQRGDNVNGHAGKITTTTTLNGDNNDDDNEPAQRRDSEGATPEAPVGRLGVCLSLLSGLRVHLSPSSRERQNHVDGNDDDGGGDHGTTDGIPSISIPWIRHQHTNPPTETMASR